MYLFCKHRNFLSNLHLGNMYYASGLLKKKDESTFSYEFVNDETYVFPFLEKYGAMRIAKKCGDVYWKDIKRLGE